MVRRALILALVQWSQLACHGGQLNYALSPEERAQNRASAPPTTSPTPAAAGGRAGASASPSASPSPSASDATPSTSKDAPRGHCTSDNVCSAAYPCQSLETGYSCRGQFADWPVRDSPNTFRVDANGTVTDTRTGLVWQREVDDVARFPSEAKAYCEQLSLDGQGWRVPAICELESIVDFTRDQPAVDPSAFPGTPKVTFVSSSAYMAPAPPGYYWYVHFGSGLSGSGGGKLHVRCVRSAVLALPSSGSGGVPPDRYEVKADTVHDTRTGLTWQQRDSGREYPWQQAEMYCRDLTLDGSGWRLPSIAELLTIVDRARAKPALDPVAFGTTTALNHWSASTSARSGSTALWGVGFQDGSTFNGGSATEPAAVRCVR